MYLNGGARRSVCELCKDRAIHEGWIREGTMPAYNEGDGGSERRRSLLGRFLARRETAGSSPSAPTLGDELDNHAWSENRAASVEAPRRRSSPREPRHV